SGCSKHMTGDRSQLTNFVHKFLGTVKFGNDQVVKIMGYGDYRIGNVTNFKDLNLKRTICVLHVSWEKARNNHINLNLKTPIKKNYIFRTWIGPMRVVSVNGKRYILVIVDDYSRFTWVKFLASKDEAPNFIIKFLKMIQVRLNTNVRNIHTDNGTEIVNQTLRDFYEQVGISHETSVAQTPQQNGVVERQNHTLVEAAHTIKPDLSYLYIFGAHCYPNNDIENLGKLQAKANIASVASPVPVKEAPVPVESTSSPSSTTVDQDAPSPSTSQTTPQLQSQTIPLSAKEESHDLESHI
nr:hypothetical protein [Tanacetum cinerariifolium]